MKTLTLNKIVGGEIPLSNLALCQATAETVPED